MRSFCRASDKQPRSAGGFLDCSAESNFIDSPNCVPFSVQKYHRDIFGVQSCQLRILKNVNFFELRSKPPRRTLRSNPLNHLSRIVTEVAARFGEQADFNGLRHTPILGRGMAHCTISLVARPRANPRSTLPAPRDRPPPAAPVSQFQSHSRLGSARCSPRLKDPRAVARPRADKTWDRWVACRLYCLCQVRRLRQVHRPRGHRLPPRPRTVVTRARPAQAVHPARASKARPAESPHVAVQRVIGKNSP